MNQFVIGYAILKKIKIIIIITDYSIFVYILRIIIAYESLLDQQSLEFFLYFFSRSFC